MPANLIETAAAASTTQATTVTVTLGAGPSAGDVLLAFVHHTDDFPATPSGWTKDKEVVTNGVLSAFSKTATGSEGTSFPFTAPTAGGMTARVLRFSGLTTINTTAFGYSSDTTSFTSGSATTTDAPTLLIGAAGLHATTLPTGDVTQGSGFTAVAADARSSNTSGRKSLLTCGTGPAATAGAYAYTGTYTAAATTSIEPMLVAWNQSSGIATVTAVKATGTGQSGVPLMGNQVPGVRAQGSGAALAPAVSGSGTATVISVVATGSGLAPIPTVDGTAMITGGAPAAGSGLAVAPTVTASTSGSVTAVKATGSGLAVAPTPGSPGVVAAVRAVGSGVAGVPAVVGSSGATVTAVRATGSGAARAPGVGVVETLPSNTGTGRVTGRFGTAEVLIGDNDGIANIFPVTDATITFTSTAAVLLNATASPAPIVILPKPIVCTLDSQGYLVDSAGHRWCDLIATDDVDLTPANRRWKVTCSAGLGIADFTIAVAGGTTVDLTTLIPT
jgi:hypothetical protein